jgi:spermidine/putrescine transport system ATP-binding protein
VNQVAADCVVELVGVSKRYGDVLAVDSVDLGLRRGEFFSLLGPSGCGKTTTLRLVGGFERPTQGQIVISGKDVARVPPYRRPVNTVFQSYALFSHLNVFDNVAFGLRERRIPRSEIRKRVTDLLELVRLPGMEQRRTRELSGGQQQRVALARAIINEPAVLLLDEPLGALDLKLRRAMQSELTQLQQSVGITFLYVTHDQEEALSMSDRVGVMGAGKLVQVGTPEELYNRPATRYVADFVGEANIIEGRTVECASGTAAVAIREAPGVVVHAATDSPVEPDRTVFVVVRPERIDVRPAVGSGAGALVGTVREVAFVGAHRKLAVEVNDALVINALVDARQGDEALTGVGSKVKLRWRSEDASLTDA